MKLVAVVQNNWWLYIHDPHDIPSSYEWNAIQLEKGSRSTVEFTVNSYHLLKSPYHTNCLDYSQTEYLSRKDCIRKCKINRSVDKCGVVSHEMDVYKDEPNVRFAQTEVELNCVKGLGLKRKCPQMCPKNDCFKQHYTEKLISRLNLNSNHSILKLAFSTDPQIAHHHKPKLETIEFLCYFASILSLWFGVSMISTFDWLKIVLTKVKQSISIRIFNGQTYTSKVFVINDRY